jgi:ABC-type Na+ efflux pump permease subunit
MSTITTRLKRLHRVATNVAVVLGVGILVYGLGNNNERLAGLGALLLVFATYSPGDGLLLLGPFARWELVRAAKRGWLFLVRAVLVLVGFSLVYIVFFDRVSGVIFDTGQNASIVSMLAQQSFAWLNFIMMVVAILFGLFQLPSIITEEKEANRLDHLLATDLRNHELLIGKLFGRFILLLMYIMSLVPVSMTIVVHGGVDPTFLFASAIILVLTYFGIAGIALAASTMFKRGTSAVVFTLFTYGGYQYLCYDMANIGWLRADPTAESFVTNGSFIQVFGEIANNTDKFAQVSMILRSYAIHQIVLFTFGMFRGVVGIRAQGRAMRRFRITGQSLVRAPLRLSTTWKLTLAVAAIVASLLWYMGQYGVLPSVGESFGTVLRIETLFAVMPLVYLVAFSVTLTHLFGSSGIPQTILMPLFWRETSRGLIGPLRFLRYFNMLYWLIPSVLIVWFAMEGGHTPIMTLIEHWIGRNQLFIGMAACVFLVLPAVWNTSRTIVQERQFDTLEALLLTDLEPHRILREKWLAAFWHGRRRWLTLILLLVAMAILNNRHTTAALALFGTSVSSTVFGLSIGVWMSVRSRTRNGAFWKLFIIWVGLAFLIILLFLLAGVSLIQILMGRPSGEEFVIAGFVATIIPPFTQIAAASLLDPSSRYFTDILQIVFAGIVSQTLVSFLAYKASVAAFVDQTRPK